MADSPSSSKPRQPRLRASCDGCFTAKVKCSKARPICSRCLACGLECRYSPSSRAGKPKPHDHNTGPQPGPPHHMASDFDQSFMMYHGYISPEELYALETGWDTPMNSSLSIGQDPASARTGDHGGETSIYTMGIPPWASMSEASAPPLHDLFVGQAPLGPHESFPHTGIPMSLESPWTAPGSGSQQEGEHVDTNSSATPESMVSSWLPSPAQTPTILHQQQAAADTGCLCFSFCMQSFQELHNASGLTASPLGKILSLNRKAVESCQALLFCPMCTRGPGISTTVMFVAAILSKAAGYYRTAAQVHIGGTGRAGPDSPCLHRDAASATRQEAGWLQPAALAREMDGMREVCSRFRDVCADLPDESEVNRAMVGYVGRSLGAAMEAVKKMQGEWYA